MALELLFTSAMRARLACGIAAAMAMGGAARAEAQDAEPRGPSPTTALSDEELAALAATSGEVIELWDERPDKPFDRDTELRLTGDELAQRGAVDLATALALLPDVNVRDAGRGGWNIDIRGARKGAVRVLVDGVSVTDPYYGTFDVSTIPITDIVEIRVSTAPASPIDGPGGPGGVIEVHTRDAIGDRAVIARLTTDSLPSLGASVTGRTALAERVAIRLSLAGLMGARELDLPSGADLDEGRRATTGALRLEYRDGERRLALDGFVDDRHYVPPPNEESATATILVIDRETTTRLQVAFDDQVGATQVQGRAWTHRLARRSRYFPDPSFELAATSEDLEAQRYGAQALATRAIGKRWRAVASGTVDHERAEVYAGSPGTSLRSAGDATLIEAAAGAQFERGTVRVDGSAGVAAPIGLGADPWPEAKLVTRWRPIASTELVATVARKGRTPSLRERFDSQSGNPALGPEQSSHGELRVIAKPIDGTQLEVAPYWRRSTGSVVNDPMTNRLTNLGTVDVRGVDASAKVRLHAYLSVGGSYELTRDRARATDGGDSRWRDDPLDRLPDHRADAWVRGTLPHAIGLLARARYFGASTDKNVEVESYALLEASASARYGDWLAVARCDDLLDAAPETRNGYHLPGRVFSLVVQGQF